MTQTTGIDLEHASALAEGLQSKEKFDARAAINGTTYPVSEVKVYTAAALAHQMNLAADDLLKVRNKIENLKAADTGIVEHEDLPAAEAEAQALETKIEALFSQVRDSALTFHLRGLAPAQWRLIDKKWRKAIKGPARKNYAQTSEGEEEFEADAMERNIERIAKIQEDQIACAIVKVVNADGNEDASVWSQEDAENLYNVILQSEWEKLKAEVVNLTFAHTLFNSTIEQDADFLPKP